MKSFYFLKQQYIDLLQEEVGDGPDAIDAIKGFTEDQFVSYAIFSELARIERSKRNAIPENKDLCKNLDSYIAESVKKIDRLHKKQLEPFDFQNVGCVLKMEMKYTTDTDMYLDLLYMYNFTVWAYTENK